MAQSSERGCASPLYIVCMPPVILEQRDRWNGTYYSSEEGVCLPEELPQSG